MTETRKIFIYLAILAVILAFIGVSKLRDDFVGRVVIDEQEKNWLEYSIKEISNHEDKKDCWLYYGTDVYDITLFLQVYNADLEENCGGKINTDYLDSYTKKVLQDYKIGILR